MDHSNSSKDGQKRLSAIFSLQVSQLHFIDKKGQLLQETGVIISIWCHSQTVGRKTTDWRSAEGNLFWDELITRLPIQGHCPVIEMESEVRLSLPMIQLY